MKIVPYTQSAQTNAELVDLIMYCQNTEAQLNIKLAEQADIFDIETYYQANGGNFWLAIDQQQVVGSIGLLNLNNNVGVLKKFFTYPNYRGQPQRLGRQLFETLETYVTQETGLTQLILDTPAAETRSHYFYQKHGFEQIPRAALPVTYPFPDRDSLIFLKNY
ncbi:GNAT family N-acetyltransferase [Lactiplantibacillus pingfangensis]|uniref:GNAT family N-acetyltransferase n=1 Tax=Lactiplantibacillus pingfangensis TaxID=2559915 RepID=UPI0010F634EE|nr:GNAT family N-acetyltransferase [Lactiplantibacillus pingfangensis]